MSDSNKAGSARRTSHKLPCFNAGRHDEYGLWRLRLRATCRAKGVWRMVDQAGPSAPPPSSAPQHVTDSTANSVGDRIEKLEEACAVIISTLGDTPLRAIQDVGDDSRRLMQLLDERYASSRAASRIAVQTQVYRKVYGGCDMARFIDELASLFSKVDRMGDGAAVPESRKAPMLLASIPVDSPLELTAAALRTKDVADLTWEYVASTLIDESRARRVRADTPDGRAANRAGDGDGRAGPRRTRNGTKKASGTKTESDI